MAEARNVSMSTSDAIFIAIMATLLMVMLVLSADKIEKQLERIAVAIESQQLKP